MNDFLLGVAILLACLWAFLLGYSIKEEILTQQLCSKQQYDFCEVEKISYKIKEKQDD